MRKNISKTLILVLVGMVTVVVFCPPIFALEKYPQKPIQMILPWGPGSGSDLGSRVVAEKMAEFLGQPMVSVYKAGGVGTLASAYVAGGKPDGYTLLVGSDTAIVIQPIIKKGLSYNLDSFTYVGAYSKAPSHFSVRSEAPWKTFPDFIADAKKNPKKFKVGIPGVLTTTHVAWELLCQKAGIQTVSIPYLSSGEALTALLGGDVDVAATSGVGGMSQAGTIRMLAVAEKERLHYLPNIPTLYEIGYPMELNATYSFCAPKGTPKDIIGILYKAQEKAFNKYGNEIKEKLARVEQLPYFLSGEEYYKMMKERERLFSDIGRALNVVPKSLP
jgi:tripartite-type tricarboxylate transporter receptor subunit TctC